MEALMRLMTIGVLALGLAADGCKRADTTAPAGPPPALTTEADANRAAVATPVATTGHADTDRAAAPAWREVTIPAGTALAVVLDTPVTSSTSRVEEPVTAHLVRSLSVHGETVLAEGTRLSGVVTDATRSAKVKGRAHVAVRFDTLTPRGDDRRYTIHAASVGRTAPGTKKKDALEIGAPAAGGAIIGALIGGKKGAAIGTAAGGGAGAAFVLSTRGKEVSLPKGSALMLRLSQPLTIRVKT